MFFCLGVWLGNAREKIFIKDIDAQGIMHAENISNSPQKLAVNLLSAMFSHTELAGGNCTKAIRDDILLLDQKKIRGIRGL